MFGPVDPNKGKYSWSLGVTAAAAVGGATFLVIFFAVSQRQPPLREVSKVVGLWSGLSSIPRALSAIGGDVDVPPPPGVVSTTARVPRLRGEMLAANAMSAAGVIVKDRDSGAVLFRKNEYGRRALASLTKLMSALVLLERPLDWATTTAVVAEDVVDTHLNAGEIYSIGELWQAALIGSSNKAVLTLVDASGWSRPEFVARMNQKALALGMRDTIFVEPTGLDAGNMGSASDLAILFDEAMRQEEILSAVRTKEYTLVADTRRPKRHLWSTNWLLLGWIPHKDVTIIGGKTGYIGAAGYNLAVEMRDGVGHAIDVVILGAKSHEARFTEARDLAEWVFENYTWP